MTDALLRLPITLDAADACWASEPEVRALRNRITTAADALRP